MVNGELWIALLLVAPLGAGCFLARPFESSRNRQDSLHALQPGTRCRLEKGKEKRSKFKN
jgi:hypothetical protein